jgi:type II secretory ATPase GspE/PulE/Tfp pilus assembly ATPase PilB-like protein
VPQRCDAIHRMTQPCVDCPASPAQAIGAATIAGLRQTAMKMEQPPPPPATLDPSKAKSPAPPPGTSDPAKGRNPAQRIRVSIHWPSPPFGGYPGPSDQRQPLACMIQTLKGNMVRARLFAINFESRIAYLQYANSKAPMVLRFDQMLSLTLSDPLTPIARSAKADPAAANAAIEARPRMPYRLTLTNDQSISGSTIGYVEKFDGLFLFPPVDDQDRVIRTFLPKEACRDREIGPPIGKMLVEQHAVSPEEVETAVALQKELRAQKVGDILVKHQVVTPEELLKALELQSSWPVMRVGEALIALGLIRPEQIDAALALQKDDRSAPLGELLVRQNLITRDDLRNALARKMGYPIVDVANFTCDVAALRRVPIAVARRLHVLPLVLNEHSLVVAIEDVTRRAVLDELEFVAQTNVVAALAPTAAIDEALVRAYALIGQAGDLAGADPKDSGDGGEAQDMGKLAETLEREVGEDSGPADEAQIEQSDNSLVRLINQMIIEAHAEGASDIHIECSPGREKVKIRFRKDGDLRVYLELPSGYRNALLSRIKIMCELDISERRKPQDGKINFAKYSPQHKLELRVATIPTNNGLEDVVMRLLASAKPIPLDALGLSPKNLALFRPMIERPYGLVLCVGPTGSGKTTTLHSALGAINRPESKIWTAEDPVEITQAGLRQVQVNPKIDWTFAGALKAFLRADPDVIMVGEVRDQETAHIVVEASLTGHLVLSTLHTNTAPETVTRLLDMGLDTFNFADALLGVLAQRLVRRICKHCRTERPATPEEIEELLADFLHGTPEGIPGLTRDAVLDDWQQRFAKDGRLMSYHSPGCKQCSGTGLKGRVGIHELMANDRDLRHLIQTRATVSQMQACALRNGMRTLRQDGIERVLQGLTTIEEVRSTSAAF